MKTMAWVVMVGLVLGAAGTVWAESNPVAIGVEQVTKAPFTALKNGNEHLFTPVKDIDAAALDFTDNARAAVVSVGLNLGQSVEW